MSEQPIFEHCIHFTPEQSDAILREVPAACGVLALYGANSADRPYLSKTTHLRRRLQRLLQPSEGQTSRISLRDRIAKIAWHVTGSDLESNLVLYRAWTDAFGKEEARKRLKLRTPYFVRFAAENRFPRLYVTNRLSRRALTNTFGPFASRVAAERYVDGVNDLFHIRRCYEELHPSPDHPGCVYGEMKKCSAPCQMRISDETYNAEAEEVRQFLITHGESLLATIATERERASEAMEFEAAAAAHARYNLVKDTAGSAGELVRSVDTLHAALLLPSAQGPTTADIWLMQSGCIHGPEHFSTLGVRLAKEQAEVGSSLFAQPLMLQPVPEEGAQAATESPEERLLAALTRLESGQPSADLAEMSDHLALLKRWYYRPEAKRIGAICFRENDTWPMRKMIRTAAKVSMKATPETAPAVPPPTDKLIPL